jgi:hypothetical protein
MSSHLEQWKFRRAQWKIYHRNALEQMRSPQRTNSEIGRFQHVARGFLLISVFSSPSARTKWTVSETQVRRSSQVPVASPEMSSLSRLQVEEFQSGIRRLRGEAKSKDILRLPLWLMSSLWLACEKGNGHQISMMLLFNHLKFSYLFIPTSSKNIWNKLGSSNDFPSFPGEIYGTIRKSFRISWCKHHGSSA